MAPSHAIAAVAPRACIAGHAVAEEGHFTRAAERMLPESRALGRFRRQHPAVEVGVGEDYAAELLAAVRRGELDAAITGLPDDRRPGWKASP